ncbi:hypothetical protein [Pleionea sp. CnH1-48]|uniref:hypothetical protein n=1 Tax=Pleionea sp. CnH1-48 TaxID=2954494 RepID=UPI002097D7B0|nr:hypothetical protein [Pleionea sp. CnH1-48]MCO7223756.1 hypothetical protein [Pleionea sp. CnH1-48]
MSSNLKLSLSDELTNFVNSQVGNTKPFSSPNEYLQHLIRKEMECQNTVSHIIGGIKDIKNGRISELSILDI